MQKYRMWGTQSPVWWNESGRRRCCNRCDNPAQVSAKAGVLLNLLFPKGYGEWGVGRGVLSCHTQFPIPHTLFQRDEVEEVETRVLGTRESWGGASHRDHFPD